MLQKTRRLGPKEVLQFLELFRVFVGHVIVVLVRTVESVGTLR
jgi:hypothetical protein